MSGLEQCTGSFLPQAWPLLNQRPTETAIECTSLFSLFALDLCIATVESRYSK